MCTSAVVLATRDKGAAAAGSAIVTPRCPETSSDKVMPVIQEQPRQRQQWRCTELESCSGMLCARVPAMLAPHGLAASVGHQLERHGMHMHAGPGRVWTSLAPTDADIGNVQQPFRGVDVHV